MAYPSAFMERLRSHFLLSDLIGKRVPLKKRGREYMGCCPFHSEKTPSFTVNNEKGFFHCFGCAAHGDAIEFVKRYERLTYREAIEKLARDAGIPLPTFSKEAEEKEKQVKSLTDVMEAACRWFESNLSAPEQLSARDYLQDRRLLPKTQQFFRMGYAPDGRDALKRHLLKEGYTEAQMADSGLIIRPDEGASYDRFRARIMFPIRATNGRIIAFGGRLMASSTVQAAKHLPKYLNSPETALFKKGEVLFNLDKAGAPARDRNEIIIVEGYMDAIAMAQAGIPHVVATLGTAVTAEHLHKLWQYAPEPMLCLDGDAAGHRAMLRAAELVLPLLKPGNSLRFVLLPKGEDPDSLINNRGVEQLQQALSESKTLSETLWSHFSAQFSTSAEGRAALEHKLNQLCEKIENATVMNHYKAYFKRQVWNTTTGKQPVATRRLRSVEVERLSSGGGEEARAKSARHLLKIVLLQPKLMQDHQTETYFERMECVSPALDRLRGAIVDCCVHEHLETSAELLERLERQGLGHAVHSLIKDEAIKLPRDLAESLNSARMAWEQVTRGELLSVLETEYKALENSLHAQMDEDGLTRLMELQKEIKDLKSQQKFSPPAAYEE